MQHREAIVIGAGPGGLVAGYYLAHYGFDTIILEEKITGGYAAEIPYLENYPGCSEGIKGKNLVDKMVQQCEETGVEIHQFERVAGLDLYGQKPVVKTEKSDYSAEAVIIATGRDPRESGIPGEKQFHGKGVSHCAVCDGTFFKEKKVVVVGEDSRAAEVAIFLSRFASQVKMVCAKDELCAEKVLIEDLGKKNVEVLDGMELEEIKGDAKVKSVVLANKKTGETKELDTDGVFFQLDGIPNSQIARESGIKTDKDGYILVDEKGRTNIDRVYAVGDVTSSPTKLIVAAAAQAATVALSILEHIK